MDQRYRLCIRPANEQLEGRKLQLLGKLTAAVMSYYCCGSREHYVKPATVPYYNEKSARRDANTARWP